MHSYQRLFGYIGAAAIALLLIGLAGWYFFLRQQTGDIDSLGAARGFDIAVPSFTGSRSSTSENTSEGVGGDSLLYTPQTNQRPPRLWRVSQNPVAGAGFLAGTTTLRYVERATGYVYDVNPTTGTITRRTNTLLPKIYDATVVSDGAVVLQTLDETSVRTSILGRLSTTTSEEGLSELEVASLGTGIFAITPSATRPEMLLLAARDGGGAELVRSTGTGTAPVRVMTMPLTSFEPIWLADGRIFVNERPASGISGNAYEIRGSALSPLIRNTPGLVALPRASSTALLYSSDDGARLRLFARPSENASTSELPLATTAAKCVWTPILRNASTSTTTAQSVVAYCAAPQEGTEISRFTDLWMRGAAHSQDTWFTIDAGAAKSERFFVPETSVALDVERPSMNASGEYITFLNARDKSLWVLRITE